MLQNVPLIKNCCCFETVLKCSLKSVLKSLKIVYPRQDKLQNAAQRRFFFFLVYLFLSPASNIITTLYQTAFLTIFETT